AELALLLVQPDDLVTHALALVVGLADDLARRLLRLAPDPLGLAPRVGTHHVRAPLGGDERLAQHRLGLLVPGELDGDLVVALLEVLALAPHLAERLGDAVELALDVLLLQAEDAAAQADVTD